jgi:hypothetical protein
MSLKTIEIGGIRYRWREILRLRREQARAARQPQPTLFPLKDDARPAEHRTASGRYESPSLFDDRPTEGPSRNAIG